MEPDRRHLSVLIADDNRDLAKILATLLTLGGMEVQTVYDGTQVLPAARDRKPDVLLLDIGLPGMDGYQVAEQMRADQQLEKTLIIAMSGYDINRSDSRFERAAFDHQLVKPLDFQTLITLFSEANAPAHTGVVAAGSGAS
jgi:CheY-like chemotaxis protein